MSKSYPLGKPDLSFELDVYEIHTPAVLITPPSRGEPVTVDDVDRLSCVHCLVPWPCPTAVAGWAEEDTTP